MKQANQLVSTPFKEKIQTAANRLADEHQLGACEEEYGKYTLVVAIIVLCLSGILVLGCLGMSLYALFSQNWDQGIDWSSVLMWSGGALVLLLLGGSIFWGYYISRYSRAYRYEQGLLVINARHEQIISSEAINWRDIEIIWHNVTEEHHTETVSHTDANGDTRTETQTKITITHRYRLQRKDGSIFGEEGGNHFTNMAGEITDKQLGAYIEEITLPYLLPSRLAAYQRGESVEFGALLIGQAGLDYQGRFLPWTELKELHCGEQSLAIWKRDKKWFAWASIPYAEIANVRVFCQMVDQITDAALT